MLIDHKKQSDKYILHTYVCICKKNLTFYSVDKLFISRLILNELKFWKHSFEIRYMTWLLVQWYNGELRDVPRMICIVKPSTHVF